MKTFLFIVFAALAGLSSHAQFTGASLQASGLTCSMCSKAVKNALDKVSFVEKVDVELKKDNHLKIGNDYFHFLNAANQTLNGSTSFTLVDKHFVSAKAYKKWSATSKMECMQTGRAGKCCASEGITEGTRIYHAVI